MDSFGLVYYFQRDQQSLRLPTAIAAALLLRLVTLAKVDRQLSSTTNTYLAKLIHNLRKEG
jgi:hypothetical protein